ncbi:hypothetical protein O3P69_007857 [Scylla paramamosain]|uniref:BPTI/Kunitz inhibitor domain-containing protein n=1 Tax=Scylla paramamosain TaxID=85552 RepID=A0AAW0SJ65_SCYPA
MVTSDSGTLASLVTEAAVSLTGKHCYLFNDPHIHTLDGHYYDWHGICNYTVTQPGNSLYPDYGVFSDFRHCYNSASCLHVSTFKNDRYTAITLRHNNPFTILVNNDEFVVPTTGVTEALSSHGKHPVLVWRDGDCIYLVGSSKIMIQHCRHRLDVWAHPSHGDPCTLDAAQRQELRAICSRRLHLILATDEELEHYVDACQFDLCQLRQTGATKEAQDNWLRELEILAQDAKIILAKTSGEWKPLPDVPPSQGICVPGSRWMEEWHIHPLGQEACKDGSRWKVDCNWCNCVRGGFVCSRNPCGPATFPPPPLTITALPTFPTSLPLCLQPMEPGNCYGFFPRYYFNVATRRCEYFIYGGCGGNQNNFQTLQECEKTCKLIQ